jgi:hypothetical protein
VTHLPPPSGVPRDATPPPYYPGAYVAPPPELPRPRVRVWPFLFGAAALGVAATVGLLTASWTPAQTQHFHDAYVAWSEPIPADVAEIARATGMTREAELVFRASRPAVEANDDFNEHCQLEGGAVLGCYASGTIYVYDVTDERLAGTVEVTAAHEMLHAAYERLPRVERERVDALVAAFVATLPADDPTYADLELYAPEQFADEWHSRLATEYPDLTPELEQHYARYFTDRSLVLALHVQANAAFDEIQGQIEALLAEIDTLGPEIDARMAAYDSSLATFNSDVASFNARADNGSFTSQAQFDRERAALVARSDALEDEVAAINQQVDYYNGLVSELTALDADYADLYGALDSTSTPEDLGG